jgi:hypothetical protein
MGSFKIYLAEQASCKKDAIEILNGMKQEELTEYAEFLYSEFFDPTEEYEDSEFDEVTAEEIIEMIDEINLGWDVVLNDLDMMEDEEHELGEAAFIYSDAEEKIKDSDYYDAFLGYKKGLPKTHTIVIELDDKDEIIGLHKMPKKEYEKMARASKSWEDAMVRIYESEEEELEEGVSRRMKTSNVNRQKRKFMAKSKADMRKDKTKRKKAARASKADRKRYYRANKQKIKAYSKSYRANVKSGKHKVKKRRSA